MPRREHVDVCGAQVLAHFCSIQNVIPDPANVRHSRPPYFLVEFVRVPARPDEHQQDVQFRSQRADELPRFEQDVEAFPPDINSTVPDRDPSGVRDSKLAARIMSRARSPLRNIERIEDAGDFLGWYTVALSDPSCLDGGTDDQTSALAEGQGPEASLNATPMPTSPLESGENRNS
jgi:hypothetical protein